MSVSWTVPLSDIDFDETEVEAVSAVIRSRWLTMGPLTQRFEQEFAARHESPHAVAVSNCTAALHLACAALDIGPGDEVIMPSLTFVATANAAAVCGATPVFADIISADEPTIDPDHVAALIGPRTRAIAVVHYAGYACRMQELMAIAERHGLPVIEDCAHAPGIEIDGRYLGTFGAVGCFSFFSNKNLVTGEGGMALTNDEQLAARIARLRSHGMTSGTWKRHNERPQGYDVLEAGFNYRLDEMHAALGLVQLGKLERNNARRSVLTDRYRERLLGADAGAVAFESYRGARASHILPFVATDAGSRAAAIDALGQARVQSSHHYHPVHLFQFYREHFGCEPGSLPRTEDFAARQITLPLYPAMRDEDVDCVVGALLQASVS